MKQYHNPKDRVKLPEMTMQFFFFIKSIAIILLAFLLGPFLKEPSKAGLGFPVVKKSKLFFKSTEIPPHGLPPLNCLSSGCIFNSKVFLPLFKSKYLIC